MKSGVGKTTLTVALSEFIAEAHNRKVLVIDLDPQTNATVALISQDRWKELDQSGRTVAQLFRDKIEGTNLFNPDKAIVSGVSNVHGGIESLSLLPSSFSLVSLQDMIALVPSVSHFASSPIDILRDSLSTRLQVYDFVFIDSPPNFGLVMQNGLRISDSFLIPVVPDILSTVGIPQALSLLRDFSNQTGSRLSPLGIILTKYRSTRLHETIANQLRTQSSAGNYPRVFETIIKESSRTEEAMDFETNPSTLKQKYGYGENYEAFHQLANELLEVCKPN